jgi:hypothetical protein
MAEVPQNCVLEMKFESATTYDAPDDVQFDVKITDPSAHVTTIAGFWAGNATWCARFSSLTVGIFSYVTSCSNHNDAGLQDQVGEFEVVPYVGIMSYLPAGVSKLRRTGATLSTRMGRPFSGSGTLGGWGLPDDCIG